MRFNLPVFGPLPSPNLEDCTAWKKSRQRKHCNVVGTYEAGFSKSYELTLNVRVAEAGQHPRSAESFKNSLRDPSLRIHGTLGRGADVGGGGCGGGELADTDDDDDYDDKDEDGGGVSVVVGAGGGGAGGGGGKYGDDDCDNLYSYC
ncbi:unnamed protein product [Schistocephalus solidus]|uniref:Uncharacterized protein n=1 Tax=Schistocephalus solidus TaxID=70667 RepID=A0A183T9H5_SCHSO|nr:unnamed protein product [Schistocephalus solidus]